MSHVPPVPREQLAEFEPFFQIAEASMGFVPRSLYVMGRRPEILRAFSMLAGAVIGPGTVDPGLKQLIAYVASNASGCRYCQAHTSAHAAQFGVPTQKIEHAFEFETHPDFSAPNRPRCAWRATRRWCPISSLRITSRRCANTSARNRSSRWSRCAALFGWLNRWNDTFATELEGRAAPVRRAAPRQLRLGSGQAR